MTILIKNIGELLTMDLNRPDEAGLGLICNAAIVVRDDTIIFTGEEKDLPGEKFDEVIDADGKVVMPGLVDAHTHLIFAGSRENEFAARLEGATYEEILAAGGGIHSTVKATRAASVDHLAELGLKRLDFCLEHGVTTVEIKSGYGLETETELKMLQTAERLNNIHEIDIVPTFLGAHVIPKEYSQSRDSYIELLIGEMLPEIKKNKLAEFCDVFIEHGAYSLEEAERIISAGIDNGLQPRLHVEQLSHLEGIRLAVKHKAASVDHLETITEDDIDILAGSEVTAILLPGATFFLRMKDYAPARKLIDSGVKTALATDLNPGSCMTAMPFLIMTLGCLQMGMTVPEVLKAFTVFPAESLNRTDRGVISDGKLADIIILDVDSYKMIPYQFGRNHVITVIKNGKIVIKG
ncbi:MAG: imidazolonepropionase [bacterium]|nr:imidazolonepropionase [bacterium]